MLSEALDFPTRGPHGSAALLVGSVLLLVSAVFTVGGAVLPVLLVVAFALQVALRGYYVRVLRAAAGEREPVAPSFGDVRGLLRDGLAAVGIALVYLLPVGLLFLLAAGGNLAAAVENPLQLRATTIAVAETVGSIAALLGLFAALASLYLVPGAVTLYAHEGRVRAALDLRRVVRGTVSEDYAVGWVITLVLQALLFPVVFLLYSIIVGVFLHFFLAVTVRYAWGNAIGNALDFELTTVDREGITPGTGFTPVSTPEEPHDGGTVGHAHQPSSAAAARSLPSSEGAIDTGDDGDRAEDDAVATDSPDGSGVSDPMADDTTR